MTAAPAVPRIDWRQEWFEIEDATFLNVAAQAPMPKVSLRAVQAALEWKKFPHRLPHAAYFDTPKRLRTGLARLIGGKPEEIALTTGASGGIAAVAYGLSWKSGDEILTGKCEFPLQYATWKPMEAREGVTLKVAEPRQRFISADDFIDAMTPKTRLVSASLVRFNDAVLLDAARVAAACHAQGAQLLLDVSQCCGSMPMDVAQLGADFLVCAGYKWLLSPYGTGFFWAKSECIANMRPGPFYWMAAEGAEEFSALPGENPRPVPGARRWDSPETPNFLNIAAMDASIDFLLHVGVETVAAQSRKLMDLMLQRLPKDRCVSASPEDAARRGVFACFAGRTPEKTAALYERLEKESIVVSLREGNIRVSSHLYNSERDIDRLIAVLTR